jgi:four helix bundle protein
VPDHRKLRVWQQAHALALLVRSTCESFPKIRYASLQSQTIRSAESVLFNIAEGRGAKSQPEFARFLEISIKSSQELECQLELARDYGIVSSARWKSLNNQVIDCRRMLCGLRNRIRSDEKAQSAKR